MNKKVILFFLSVLLLPAYVSLVAQPQENRFSPQNFMKELESFIVRQACLTPYEAEAFFPIFYELHDQQQAINWKIRELKRNRLPGDATNDDYLNLVDEISKLKIESAELEDTYYKKMCEEVPAKKVLDAMQAEDDFHRRMLKQLSRPPKENNKKPEEKP